MSVGGWRNSGVIESNGNGHGGRVVERKRAARKPHDSKAPPSPVVQNLAPFASVKLEAQDASMWPVHPVMWLQPAPRPVLSIASGLRVERRYAIPAPDFLDCAQDAVECKHAPDKSAELRRPSIAMVLPQSGLEPLGWDPRAARRMSRIEERREAER